MWFAHRLILFGKSPFHSVVIVVGVDGHVFLLQVWNSGFIALILIALLLESH